jgi:hypothetical protein
MNTLIKKNIKKEIDFTNTCSICNLDYNKSYRKKIICYCDLELCKTCIQTYILSKNQIPHCFNCNIEWSREFMINNISASWVNNEYKLHHENYLFSIEESYFNETMLYIEHKNKKKKEIKVQHDIIKEYNVVIESFKKKIDECYENINLINNNVKIERKEFICKCPNNDCMGYLSSQHKCDLCNNFYCCDCNELIGENKTVHHVCNPDTVESVKILKKECKNCPKCSVLVYKIDGCDMMWCVLCHTSFSWKTLNILNGKNIHNPHYFEWLRTQNNENIERNPNDILCGREIDNRFSGIFLSKIKLHFNLPFVVKYNLIDITKNSMKIINDYNVLIKIKKEYKKYNNIYFIFENILISIGHINAIDIHGKFNNRINENDKISLRASFMEKEITDEEFKKDIYRRNKTFEKNNEFTTLLRMYINCLTDIFYRMYDNVSIENVDNYLTEINSLIEYVNKQLKIISKIYSCVHYNISESTNWLLVSIH